MPEKQNSQTITGTTNQVNIIVNLGGATSVPLTFAGQPIMVTKTAASQVASVHGTVAGIVFANPS
jgi:hypothetical protein